ncbi:MAG: alpha/beta hydrolase [Cardiobacteriaceae bacterium]|nr:alpha/beta hydrolase [Cardiobacteriaceae bacterium]
MKKVYIIHGYGATAANHWFSWLQDQARAHGATATALTLPDSENPDFSAWQQGLHDAIGMPQADDIFVAHSLGVISLLHYLTAMSPQQIGGLVLVSGFVDKLPGFAAIGDFDMDDFIARANVNLSKIAAMTPEITCVISDNDHVVPSALSHQLAEKLRGRVVSVAGGGHFLGREGFTELPQAWQAVAALL